MSDDVTGAENLTSRAAASTGPFIATHSQFALRATANSPAWLDVLRQEDLALFMKRGLPTRRDEEWKYTSLRPLEGRAYAVSDAYSVFDVTRLAPVTDAADITLVFVDGVLATGLSRVGTLPAGISILPLADAARDRKEQLSALLAAPPAPSAVGVANPFDALNGAFLRHGIVVEVAKSVAVDRVIHLVFAASEQVSVEGSATAAFVRNLIVLGEQAEATVVETYLGAPEGTGTSASHNYFINPLTDVRLARGAKLKHVKVIADSDSATHIGHTRVLVERNASFEGFVHSQGGRLVRNDCDVKLAGEGAHATLDGLYLAAGEQHVDHHTSIDHSVPNATSAQLYKGVLGGKGRAVFNGKVFVRKDAQRTSAQQLNKTLLLSREAEIDTKPELQIDADDVKCSHGAAIGQLADDEIFYLQSRGIDRARAVSILSQAYADEVILRLPIPAVQLRLRKMAHEWLLRVSP